MNTLIIIPCLNEARSLPRLFQELDPLELDGMEVVVIDDGSTDNTYEIASRYCRCVKLPVNLGIGGAVQTGLKIADREGHHFAAQVDGDGQHPADEIEKLITYAREHQIDLLIGSRFHPESEKSFQSSRARRMGIFFIRTILKLFFKTELTDPTSGFRIYNRNAIRLFANEYPTDYPEPIAITLAMKHGLKVAEVPVRMAPREFGESSIHGFKNASYMLRVLGYIFLNKLRRAA